MEQIEITLQRAKVLCPVSEKYIATDTKKGINPDLVQTLKLQTEDTKAKNVMQQKAVEKVGDLTKAQNTSMANGLTLYRMFQNAARTVYGKDNDQKMSEFHIGVDPMVSVKKMSAELEYMKSKATEKIAELKKGGVDEADVAQFDTIIKELDDNDAEQENGKNKQKIATRQRDDSMKDLQKTISKIQSNAKTVFGKEPTILMEFELPTDRGGGGRTLPPQPPQQPARSSPIFCVKSWRTIIPPVDTKYNFVVHHCFASGSECV